jgi:hypothetical protein
MLNISDVKQLLARADEQTFSLYLDVDRGKQVNQSSHPGWRTYLKQAIRDFESQVPKRAEFAPAIQERVARVFNNGYSPAAKSVVSFFTPTSEEVHELEVPVESRWSFGRPLVAPLLWLIDEFEPYLVLMVDREKAELITAYLGTIQEAGKLETSLHLYDFGQKTLMPGTSTVSGAHPVTHGSNRDAFQDTVDDHTMRFYREVVEHVERIEARHPRIRIVVGGSEQSALAVRSLLPERLSVVAVMGIPMYLNSSDIVKRVLPVAIEYERNQELTLVQQVIDFAKAGGRGALGRKAVDEALTMQRVETLLLPWPVADEVEATDLSMRTFESGGRVELIHGAAAERLADEGSIAARLYYTL